VTNLLLEQPYLGHPIDDMPEFQKISIPFGKYGYVIKYRVEGKKNCNFTRLGRPPRKGL